MKKTTLKLVFTFMAVAVMFTSCDDGTDPVPPTMKFFAGEGLLTEDATVMTGESVGFSWQVTKGDAKLSEFTIRLGSYDIDGFPNDDIDNDTYEDTFDTVFSEAGSYAFTFIATDKDGETATEEITVTVSAALTDQGSFDLGASGNSTLGSYYSVTEGVMLSAEAKTNADKVDIVFDADGTAAKLTSPSNSTVSEISASGRLTTFAIVLLDFDAATSADLDAVDPGSEEVTVAVGDVVVFKTADAVKGILEVTSVDVATNGSATISVKVK